MARPWRIELENAFYQVIAVANGTQRIFMEETDRKDFLTLLGQFSRRFNIDLYVYLLMPDHYKLLLKTRFANLSRAMQWLGSTYTRRFNNRQNIRGHLFQGRFKSIIVEGEKHLVRLSCDVHCGPLYDGLVQDLKHYPFSSYLTYAYSLPGPSWLKTDLILGHSNSQDRHRAYRRKVIYHLQKGIRLEGNAFKHGFIFGSEDFAQKIRNRFLPKHPDVDIPQQRSLYRAMAPMPMAARLARALKFDLRQIRRAPRVPAAQKRHRDMIVYFMWSSGLFSNRQIGEQVGLSYSMVSRAASDYRKEMERDDALKHRTAKMRARLGL
jgi:REP element-mobilizing transposase RayT